MHTAQNDYIDHFFFLIVRWQFEKHCTDHIFEQSDARNRWQRADRAKENNFPSLLPSRMGAVLVTLNPLEEDKTEGLDNTEAENRQFSINVTF